MLVLLGDLALASVFVGVLCLSFSAPAQMTAITRGFKLLDYYTATPGANATNLLKAQITGAEARPLTDGLELVSKVRIEDYLENGMTNLVATAPDCIVDYRSRVAFSSSRLHVQTANGQLSIEGDGFFYQQTNFNLVISNGVETTIHRELIQSTNFSSISFPQLGKTNAPAGSNELIKIFADRFVLESASGLATYSGHVRVEDRPMEMTCESLIIRRSTNGNVESIVADQNISLTNRLDHSWTTGDRATYSLDPDHELVVLTGRQARWRDAERQSTAGMFIFDRKANTLRAELKPSVRLPRSALSQTDWPTFSPTPITNALALTNEFVDILAEQMIIQLPTTNQPARRIAAHTNVVITSAADRTRATAEHLLYSEGAGTVELTGHAVWEAGLRLIKGEILLFDRSNRVFTARPQAYLKMPLSSIRRSALARSLSNSVLETVEVFAEELAYRPDALVFSENVRANYFEGAVLHGWLTCGHLNFGFTSNSIETIIAKRNVALNQPSAGTNGSRGIDRNVNCEVLTVHFYTNGLLQSILAESNVHGEQIERRPDRPAPIRTQFTAGLAKILFFSYTNQIREMVAEDNVSIAQDARKAHGNKAFYSAANNAVELTGHPTAETPLGKITEAEALIWECTHNILKARGKKVVGQSDMPALGTNRLDRFLR